MDGGRVLQRYGGDAVVKDRAGRKRGQKRWEGDGRRFWYILLAKQSVTSVEEDELSSLIYVVEIIFEHLQKGRPVGRMVAVLRRNARACLMAPISYRINFQYYVVFTLSLLATPNGDRI